MGVFGCACHGVSVMIVWRLIVFLQFEGGSELPVENGEVVVVQLEAMCNICVDIQ